jgi:RND family efflux transporter MFP subunit
MMKTSQRMQEKCLAATVRFDPRDMGEIRVFHHEKFLCRAIGADLAVAQSDLLRLRRPVPEADVPYIQIGGEVQVKVNSTGRSFVGKIIRFTRALDTNTRTMLTEVDLPNPNLVLSPGMYAETVIQLQQKSNARIVPFQAIVQNGDEAYVLVVNASNHVEKRNVTLGIQTANRAEITSGVQEGDRVIASGQGGYQNGELVAPHAAFIPTAKQEVSE